MPEITKLMHISQSKDCGLDPLTPFPLLMMRIHNGGGKCERTCPDIKRQVCRIRRWVTIKSRELGHGAAFIFNVFIRETEIQAKCLISATFGPSYSLPFICLFLQIPEISGIDRVSFPYPEYELQQIYLSETSILLLSSEN